MRRALRYAVALVVAALVTGGVAVAAPATHGKLLLLAAIAQVYAVGTAIALRHPHAIRRTDGPRWASAAFAGVLTFAVVSLLHAVEPNPNLPVAVLGWGVGAFGFAVGLAFEREHAADG